MQLVKSFGGLCNTAESLDDFRYSKARFHEMKMLHSVSMFPCRLRGTRLAGEPKIASRFCRFALLRSKRCIDSSMGARAVARQECAFHMTHTSSIHLFQSSGGQT